MTLPISRCIEVLEAPGDIPGVSRVVAMQVLIDHGVVWSLRPEFGMLAEWLIDEGLCTPRQGCGRVGRCGRVDPRYEVGVDTYDK